jgi:hypothetical protein
MSKFEVVLPTSEPDEASLVKDMLELKISREILEDSYPPPFEEFIYRCDRLENLEKFVQAHWPNPEELLKFVEEVA